MKLDLRITQLAHAKRLPFKGLMLSTEYTTFTTAQVSSPIMTVYALNFKSDMNSIKCIVPGLL